MLDLLFPVRAVTRKTERGRERLGCGSTCENRRGSGREHKQRASIHPATYLSDGKEEGERGGERYEEREKEREREKEKERERERERERGG